MCYHDDSQFSKANCHSCSIMGNINKYKYKYIKIYVSYALFSWVITVINKNKIITYYNLLIKQSLVLNVYWTWAYPARGRTDLQVAIFLQGSQHLMYYLEKATLLAFRRSYMEFVPVRLKHGDRLSTEAKKADFNTLYLNT